MAPLGKDAVLGLLKEHGVQFEVVDHAPVMTSEAQVRGVWAAGNGCSPPKAVCESALSLIVCSLTPPALYAQAKELASTGAKVTKNLFLRVS